MTKNEQIEIAFTGLRCTNVVIFSQASWRFVFEERTVLDVRCPWRIVTSGGVLLGHCDHQQQFGLLKPMDAKQIAQRLLEAIVVQVTIREGTTDLFLVFENGVALEIFNTSSGYEGWECSTNDGFLAIAMGGGGLATREIDPPTF